ncbi:hypothetical protein I4U23_006070 [Adineta vaga]|nr:hypothetical protein I4U23_006070 [Adineta vaga]
MTEFPPPDKRILPHKIHLASPSHIDKYNIDVDRFIGSIVGLAVGDALGASSEFRPHDYFISHPVKDMKGGGTWGLEKGKWTDDTSMALCLASSLITKKDYNPYDQMVRYKWWFHHGYLSSTGACFDIGNATRDSIDTFARRQKTLIKHCPHNPNDVDKLPWEIVESDNTFDVNCSSEGVAGNGALMRLAPVPLFFYKFPELAVEYSGRSARLTHGDQKAVDACRYYAALIVAAVNGESKDKLLNERFYENHLEWFGSQSLCKEILDIAHGSYKRKRGYDDGIRGKGYVVNALEAALWAFWDDENSFKKGALAAVNLGDDTDTTAAIYGQLAGACYGYNYIPKSWRKDLYAHDLLVKVGEWLCFLGSQYNGFADKHKVAPSTRKNMKQYLSGTISLGSSLIATSQTPVVSSSDYQPNAYKGPTVHQDFNRTQAAIPRDTLLSSGRLVNQRPAEQRTQNYQSHVYEQPITQSSKQTVNIRGRQPNPNSFTSRRLNGLDNEYPSVSKISTLGIPHDQSDFSQLYDSSHPSYSNNDSRYTRSIERQTENQNVGSNIPRPGSASRSIRNSHLAFDNRDTTRGTMWSSSYNKYSPVDRRNRNDSREKDSLSSSLVAPYSRQNSHRRLIIFLLRRTLALLKINIIRTILTDIFSNGYYIISNNFIYYLAYRVEYF